jgi:AcrR family transcriptional regulator
VTVTTIGPGAGAPACCAESGLSAGAIYGHHKSKNELIQLTVADLLERRFDDLSGVLSAEHLVPPGELIGLFLRGVRSEIGDVSILVQLWATAVRDAELRRMASGIAAKIQGMFNRYLTAWHEQEGMPPAEAQDRAARESAICVGIAQGYIVQAAILDGFDGGRLHRVGAVRLPLSAEGSELLAEALRAC